MLEFVAIGPNPDQRWRRPLPDGQVIRLGRAPLKGWSVPWDLRISRDHVDLKRVGNRLEVHCLETARNPVYRLGEPQRQFSIVAGEDFRIGATTFRVDEVESITKPKSELDTDSPTETPTATSDLEALKSQVAALQAQLAAQAESQHRQPQRHEPDSELEQLRSQVEALKSQMSAQRRPLDDKDREIQELRARLEALDGAAANEVATDNVADDECAAEPTRIDAPPKQQQQPRQQQATPKQDVAPHEVAPHEVAPQSDRPPASQRHAEKKPADRNELQPPTLPREKPPRDGASPDAPQQRKSTLFVLKAQIEAQAAKMHKKGPAAPRAESNDSKQSDIEALKSLLEARAENKARRASQRPGRTDSSLRESHITALMALHEAREAEKSEAGGAAKDPNGGAYDSDEVEPVLIEAVEDEKNGAAVSPPSGAALSQRLWNALPDDVQQLVRSAAAGAELDEAGKARIVAALNQVIVRREVLVEQELRDGLAAMGRNDAASGAIRYSEIEIRHAARRVISQALAGAVSAAPDPRQGAKPVARLAAGQSFGLAETLLGRAHEATYVAGGSDADTETPPIELIRIDAAALWALRESSPAFRAACDQLRGKQQ
ncbi:MAG: hypothetical protein RIC55_10230 [Pirellulaceae bacterium]